MTVVKSLDAKLLVEACIAVCEDRQAKEIIAYDVRGTSTLADFIIVCSGNSATHLQAISSHLADATRELGVSPRAVEGTPASRWLLLDYSDVVIHLFHPETRAYYDIEGLFKQAKVMYPAGLQRAT